MPEFSFPKLKKRFHRWRINAAVITERQIKFKNIRKTFFLSRFWFQLVFILFIANVVIFRVVQVYILSQNCLTIDQIINDQRCLYILGNNVYEKGTRAKPHQNHPCGTDVTEAIKTKPFHLTNPAKYLDPNFIAPICSGNSPAATPAPTPQPTPRPSPQPTPAATPTAHATAKPTPQPSPAATPLPGATAKPTLRPTPQLTPAASTVAILLPRATAKPTPAVTPAIGGAQKNQPPPPPQNKAGANPPPGRDQSLQQPLYSSGQPAAGFGAFLPNHQGTGEIAASILKKSPSALTLISGAIEPGGLQKISQNWSMAPAFAGILTVIMTGAIWVWMKLKGSQK